MLLQGFLGGDGIKKELTLVFGFLGTAAVAAGLRHVIAPLIIELGQLIEFSLELFVVSTWLRLLLFLGSGIGGELFQHRIRFHLLLNEVAQFEKWRLQNEKTLLELRGKDLLQR